MYVAKWSESGSVKIPDERRLVRELVKMWSMSVAEVVVMRVGRDITGLRPCCDVRLSKSCAGTYVSYLSRSMLVSPVIINCLLLCFSDKESRLN